MTALDRDYAEEAANQSVLDEEREEARKEDEDAARIERIAGQRAEIARAARHRRHQEDGVKARLAASTDRGVDALQVDVDRIATHRTAAEVYEVVLAGTEDGEEIPPALPLGLLLEVVKSAGSSLAQIRGAGEAAEKLDRILRGA